jgi:hypothetical protein
VSDQANSHAHHVDLDPPNATPGDITNGEDRKSSSPITRVVFTTGSCGPALLEAEAFRVLASNSTTRSVPMFLITAGDAFDIANATLMARLGGAGCVDNSPPQLQITPYRAPGPEQKSSFAVMQLSKAISMVDALPYLEPPFWPINLRACLGQTLLDEQRYADAENVFTNDLAIWPENGWSLKGLQLALEAQGRDSADVKTRFDKAWLYADVPLTRACF